MGVTVGPEAKLWARKKPGEEVEPKANWIDRTMGGEYPPNPLSLSFRTDNHLRSQVMGRYIDGFALPIPRSRLSDYKRVVTEVAEIWKEYGALEYVEFEGDDLNREGTGSFLNMLSATEDEVVVLGWVMFDSREARDLANRKVEKDPRMSELVGPLLGPPNPVFDSERMAYGGFRPLISSSKE